MVIHILNAQTGHTTLSFDPNKPDEVEQAKTQIADLIMQGYSIFCNINGKEERITSFDPKRSVYLIGKKEVSSEQTEDVTAVPPSAGGCALAF